MGGYHTLYVTYNIQVIKYVIQDYDVNTNISVTLFSELFFKQLPY